MTYYIFQITIMSKIGLIYRVSSKPQETDVGGLNIQRMIGREVSNKLNLTYYELIYKC